MTGDTRMLIIFGLLSIQFVRNADLSIRILKKDRQGSGMGPKEKEMGMVSYAYFYSLMSHYTDISGLFVVGEK
jgi:hypothetical protein